MAHLIETIAYAGEAPWHKLGTKVEDCISADDMRIRAGLNWDIRKEPLITSLSNSPVNNSFALVRSSDSSVLGLCGKQYIPVQPEQVLSFFHEFVEKGGMKMETAGSLDNGRHIWALANIQEKIAVGKSEDIVGGYLLFSSPNVVGRAMRIMFTPVRVVCNNTLTEALGAGARSNEFRLHHSQKFDPEVAKNALGLAKGQLLGFGEKADLLAKTKVKSKKQLQEYFMEIWPANDNMEVSRTAEAAMTIFSLQPGANYFPDSWWNAFNTVTYIVDHIAGRNDNNRLRSAWFGHGQRIKKIGMQLALKAAV